MQSETPKKNWHLHLPGPAWRVLSFLLAACVLLICFTQWNRWEGAARYQTTDDAYLQTDLTQLSAEVPGYVEAMPVQDYDHVRAGQLIVQIDADDYRAAVAQAQAGLAASQAQLEEVQDQRPMLEANLQAALAVLAGTSATLAQSARDVARQRRLLATGSSSTEDLERVETTHAQLTAQHDQNQAQADAIARQIDLLIAQEHQAEAAIATQQAAVEQAIINLSHTEIIAPVDGMIGLRQVFPGQFLAAGTQVTTLASLPNIWVIANYKETQLTHVVSGDTADIFVDAFPEHRLRGYVVAISPASGAELALLPPDNATGNFTKIVQRVAVKIVIDDFGGLAGRLRPGMSVIPTIDTLPPSGPRP